MAASHLDRALEFAGTLAVRLTQGAARDLSDGEMIRCFGECAASERCLALGRVLRDAGEFVLAGDEWRAKSGQYDDTPVAASDVNLREPQIPLFQRQSGHVVEVLANV